MAGWRFWGRASKEVPVSEAHQPSIEDAAAEGVAMALQAAVMALKNRILVSAHTEPDEFEIDLFIEDARDILEGLARESDEAAQRTRHDREAAALLRGRGMHQHDYRRRDLGLLTVREQSFQQVASTLREHAAGEDSLRQLVVAARDQAWAELAREMERRLDRTALLEHGDEHYAEERDERLREFLNVDLFRLQMQVQQSATHTDEHPATEPEY